ncbi:hypothetical protein BD311DRAFT_650906 [Dichomitus squalens]|uniref:Uncharacterized protein n=1 Tax=Dichomitus squalens TaxID=114155 RepID=A0A4Q9N2C5_9APHY|nr:hypothetical protein BD311DRAFT_650906 [Dichomitus squalens]
MPSNIPSFLLTVSEFVHRPCSPTLDNTLTYLGSAVLNPSTRPVSELRQCPVSHATTTRGSINTPCFSTQTDEQGLT